MQLQTAYAIPDRGVEWTAQDGDVVRDGRSRSHDSTLPWNDEEGNGKRDYGRL